jgi:enoyl-CoA hydratase/carnithine racemase
MIIKTDHGVVRELRLNRPPANALSPELLVALKEAVEIAPKEGVRALVLAQGWMSRCFSPSIVRPSLEPGMIFIR